MYNKDGNEIALFDGYKFVKEILNKSFKYDPTLVIPKNILVVEVVSKHVSTGNFAIHILGYYYEQDAIQNKNGHRTTPKYFKDNYIVVNDVRVSYLYSWENHPF
jgi:hypothetical protein